jgi:hypothetical protein
MPSAQETPLAAPRPARKAAAARTDKALRDALPLVIAMLISPRRPRAAKARNQH